MNNIFKGAKFGDKFVCRNGTIAYYGRYSEKDDKYFLLVNDIENDYIIPYSDGHLFHPDEEDKVLKGGPHKDKTIYELYGWNKEEMRNHRLDIVSKYKESIDEDKLDDFSFNYANSNAQNTYIMQLLEQAYKSGYKKAKGE